MEQEKANKIIKIIVIAIIVVVLCMVAFFLLQTFVFKGNSNKGGIFGKNQNNKDGNIQNEQDGNIIVPNIDLMGNNVNNEEANSEGNTNINDINLNDIGNNENNEENPSDENNNNTLTGIELSQSYYYNQLDKNGKIIYDKLKENKDKLKTGNYKFDFGTEFNTLLHQETGEKELNQAFQSAWNAFSYDQADIFYIDIDKMVLQKEDTNIGGVSTHRVSIGPGERKNYLKDEFQTKEQIDQAEKYIKFIVDQILEQTKRDSAVEKAKRIHNWLVESVEYDTEKTSANRFHIYGAIHDQKAVCEGYARSFKYLMEKVNVPCILVSGMATNSEKKTQDHAWNYIQINGGWYAVDVTWDDPILANGATLTQENRYRYFLKGSNTFLKDHKENGVLTDNSMEFKFPTLAIEDYKGF